MPTSIQEIAGLLLLLIRAMVTVPEAVQVTTTLAKKTDPVHRLDVHVHPKDVGRLIGTAGRNARAIRAVLNTIANTQGLLVKVEFHMPNSRAELPEYVRR